MPGMCYPAPMLRWVLSLIFAATLVASSGARGCDDSIADEATPHLVKLAQQGKKGLRAPRVQLRTPRPSDLALLLPIFCDYPTVRYTWFAFDEGEERWNLVTLAERFDWQASEELKGERRDFVITLNSGTVIGRCALYKWKEDGAWEFGITVHRDYWGQGYAVEVIDTAFRFAFEELEATKVLMRVLPENGAMIHVCNKIGIPKTLHYTEDSPEAPFFHHYSHYAIKRDDWAKLSR